MKKPIALALALSAVMGLAACTTTKPAPAPAPAPAQPAPAPAANEITSIKALNAITVEVTFAKPLPAEETALDAAQKNFLFDHDLKLANVPQLKTGATATYILPVNPQTAGTTYALTYMKSKPATFAGSDAKIKLDATAQVNMDTFEITSNLSDGVTDYENVVAADVGKRGGLEFTLDASNQAKGRTWTIIPSLRTNQVTLTPAGGAPIQATYVPFTQATDGRQAPKYRLPQGESLKPGVTYTVSAPWATFNQATFTAKEIAPLTITAVAPVNESSFTLTLAADPKDELFAMRRVTLKAADGTELVAQYKFLSRKGAEATFDLQNGGKLAPKTTYTVTTVGNWATANGVTLTTK